MAKLYQLHLTSEEGKQIKVGVDEKGDVYDSQREVEVRMLTNCLILAAQGEKDYRIVNCCYDVIEQIENLNDTDNVVEVTSDDLNRIKKGWDVTAENMRRPAGWVRCHALLKQLENPQEKQSDNL